MVLQCDWCLQPVASVGAHNNCCLACCFAVWGSSDRCLLFLWPPFMKIILCEHAEDQGGRRFSLAQLHATWHNFCKANVAPILQFLWCSCAHYLTVLQWQIQVEIQVPSSSARPTSGAHLWFTWSMWLDKSGRQVSDSHANWNDQNVWIKSSFNVWTQNMSRQMKKTCMNSIAAELLVGAGALSLADRCHLELNLSDLLDKSTQHKRNWLLNVLAARRRSNWIGTSQLWRHSNSLCCQLQINQIDDSRKSLLTCALNPILLFAPTFWAQLSPQSIGTKWNLSSAEDNLCNHSERSSSLLAFPTATMCTEPCNSHINLQRVCWNHSNR